MENATPQIRELARAGKDKRTKSFSNKGFFSKIALKRSFIPSLQWEYTKQMINCTIRAMVVARATPRTPNLGAPKSPKINTAFKEMLRNKVNTLMAVLTFTRSTLRNVWK